MTFTSGATLKARFIDRPNQFLVRCHLPGAGNVKAFLPNPGRMWELLLPGATLLLRNAESTSLRPRSKRKTKLTVQAVEQDGAPIFLDTHLANQVAQFLIEEGRIPGLAGFEVIRREVPLGHSRFDFLLGDNRRKLYLEVKSCTMFGNDVAMFPDAGTERGRRHLVELSELKRRGVTGAVLFLVHTPRARWFMPDYHTDLAFAQTFLEARKKLPFFPMAIEWKSDLSLAPRARLLEIPWSYLKRETKDKGSYLLLLKLARRRRIEVGRLGRITFQKGHYIYVGSAMAHLSTRIARHVRKMKTMHWHIDYLREHVDKVVPVPIRSSRREECNVARAFSELFAPGPPGFGSSDCDCHSHLFHHEIDPLHDRRFHRILQRFRMRHPT